MTLNRRYFMTGALAAGSMATMAGGLAEAGQVGTHAPELAANGLFEHGWFADRANDLRASHDMARDSGKHLAVYLEQRGCHACREMHMVNLAREDISGYVRDNFINVQLDVNARESTIDLDGQSFTQNDLANRWQVVGTPTVVFLSPDLDIPENQSGHLSQISRIQGYLPPFVFYTYYEWVREGHHETTGFRTYARAQYDAFLARGGNVETWSIGS